MKWQKTPTEKKMIKLELTIEQVQLVLNALSQLPYATVATTLEAIKTTAQEQLKASKEVQDAQAVKSDKN